MVQVVFTEDMAENPLETLEEVLKFLALDMVDPEGDKVGRSRLCTQYVCANISGCTDKTVVAKYSRYFNSDHIDVQLTVEVLYEYLTLLKGLRRKQEWVDIVGARYNMADREKKERLDLQVMAISGCHVKVLLNAVCMWQMGIRRKASVCLTILIS